MSLRTLTYVVKMDVGDGKQKTKDFRVTLKTMEQDATKASASVDKLAKSLGEKYGANVKTAIDNTKTIRNEMQAAAREVNRAEKNFERLSNEYKHLTARTGKSAEQQEKMNALQRLGAGATLTQRKGILKLVKAQQEQVKVTNRTQRSMRGLRGQAQNLGWQLQDISVQAQMGTDALVILGQQGSQLASGFGAGGALVGAGIAVVSALAGVAFATDKTAKSMKSASDIVQELVDDYDKLSEKSKELTQTALSLEISKQEKALKKLKEEQKDAVGFWDLMLDSDEERRKAVIDHKLSIEEQTRSLEKLKKQQKELGVDTKDYTEIVTEMNKPISDLIVNAVELGNTYNFNARELALYEAASHGANDSQIAAINIAYDRVEALEKEAKAVKAAQKAAKEAAKQAERDKRDRSKLEATLTDTGKLAALDAQYKREQELLAGNQEALKALEENYVNDRLKISGTFWERYAATAKDSLEDIDDQMAESIDRFNEGFGDAIGNAVVNSEDLGDAMVNVFKDVTSSMVSFFAEWAAQELAMWALKQITTKSELAMTQAVVTAESQSNAYNAAAAAYKSAAAIPYVGWILAPVAGAAAYAATSAFGADAVSSFAGAFDKGGMIPAGMSGIVSEYGDELVGGTMVYNGSPNSLKVTGREDTAAMMQGGNRNTFNINSHGNASPEAIARATARALKKGSKRLDNSVFDSMNRGRKNKGKRFNA